MSAKSTAERKKHPEEPDREAWDKGKAQHWMVSAGAGEGGSELLIIGHLTPSANRP